MEVDITLSKCCFVHSKKVSAFVYLPPQTDPPLYSELHAPGEWYMADPALRSVHTRVDCCMGTGDGNRHPREFVAVESKFARMRMQKSVQN